MEYPEKVRRYFETAPEAAGLEGEQGFCVAGDAGRESEGLRVWFGIRVEAGKVVDACFRAYGCPYAIGTAAHVAGLLRGRDLASNGIDPLAIARELELPAEKVNCALCAEDAVSVLWSNWRGILQSKPVEV